MINWRNGKGGFVGAQSRLIKGVFQYSHTITTELVIPPIWTVQTPDATSWSDQTADTTIWSVQTPDSTTWTDQ